MMSVAVSDIKVYPLQTNSGWLVHGDCLDELPKLKERPRLIFADPPYNIGVDYGPGKKADKRDPDDYLAWCESWMQACVDVLADDGSLWVMICDEWAAHFGIILQRLGLHRRAWIKWYETFGVNCTRNFNRTSRHIFYCVKDPERFVFNRDAVIRPSDRQTKYNDKRADPAGKILDDVWQVPRLVGNARERVAGVPTQLPLAILRRIVGCASNVGDLLADPFCGSGTTAVAACELERHWWTCDVNKSYLSITHRRVQKAYDARKCLWRPEEW
ncbi:MAG: site-specific DNA-methyltransferase [Phycisphaerales bacterium]|nr:MAG: site-specific DNA-methyltransferase [Phycisphaerales bacterium]